MTFVFDCSGNLDVLGRILGIRAYESLMQTQAVQVSDLVDQRSLSPRGRIPIYTGRLEDRKNLKDIFITKGGSGR